MKKKKEKASRDVGVFREYFELITETAVFVFFVITFVVQAFRIPTPSMEGTLLVGDFLLVNKLAYCPTVFPIENKILPRRPLERGDIVVFKYPRDLSKDYVKRAIALEGDTLESRDKQLFVNGRPVREDYKSHRDPRIISREGDFPSGDLARDNFGPITVPAGQIFAMGDNRDNSLDSRYWGFLPVDNLKGRPWLIYFSHQSKDSPSSDSGGSDRILGFLPKPRLNRLLHIIH